MSQLPKIEPVPREKVPAFGATTKLNLETHSQYGWPKEGACRLCGARAVLIHSNVSRAQYECRGTAPNASSAFGPDRCGKGFLVTR